MVPCHKVFNNGWGSGVMQTGEFSFMLPNLFSTSVLHCGVHGFHQTHTNKDRKT